jgi:hypothetical protein
MVMVKGHPSGGDFGFTPSPSRKYTADMRSFDFVLPGAGEFPVTPIPRTQCILDLSNEARAVILSATLFSAGVYLRFAPLAAGTAFPYAIIAFTQGPVGGETPTTGAGVGQGTRYADVLTPDVPKYYVIPPGKELWANVRGGGAATNLRLSVVTTSLVESSAGEQAAAVIIAGLRRVIHEDLPVALARAKQLILGGK